MIGWINIAGDPSYSYRKTLFNWSDNPALITDAVENVWSRFAFTDHISSSSVRSNRFLSATAAFTTTTTSRHHSPTSKSAIDAIPTVIITSEFLHIDPIVLCAVCKDQFLIDDETKQLPCKHMYHPDCILPWLSNHNSCPVCRFQLPKEAVAGDVKVRRRSRSRVLRFQDLVEDVDDEAMLGIGFRNFHHQYLQSEVNADSMLPFAHIGQTVEVDVLPDSDQSDRLGHVSGWPNWPVNMGAADGGVNSGWEEHDADAFNSANLG